MFVKTTAMETTAKLFRNCCLLLTLSILTVKAQNHDAALRKSLDAVLNAQKSYGQYNCYSCIREVKETYSSTTTDYQKSPDGIDFPTQETKSYTSVVGWKNVCPFTVHMVGLRKTYSEEKGVHFIDKTISLAKGESYIPGLFSTQQFNGIFDSEIDMNRFPLHTEQYLYATAKKPSPTGEIHLVDVAIIELQTPQKVEPRPTQTVTWTPAGSVAPNPNTASPTRSTQTDSNDPYPSYGIMGGNGPYSYNASFKGTLTNYTVRKTAACTMTISKTGHFLSLSGSVDNKNLYGTWNNLSGEENEKGQFVFVGQVVYRNQRQPITFIIDDIYEDSIFGTYSSGTGSSVQSGSFRLSKN